MAEHFPPLRLVFAGTPAFAATHLQALLESRHHLVAAYTQPDRPAGRGKKLTPSPVKLLAQSASVPVMQPPSLRQELAQAELAALQPDALVVVAYGLILPQAVLDIPRLGCINVHASLLPRWRGAAPIQRALEAGDKRSGVTIMQMDAGLDTGPILSASELAITAKMNAGQLHDALAELGKPALVRVLDSLPHYLANAREQDDGQASYAHKIEKAEAELDWDCDALVLERKIQAFNPYPVVWTSLVGQRIKVWEAEQVLSDLVGAPGEIIGSDSAGLLVACGSGTLRLERLQLPGGKPLAVHQLLLARAEQFAPGVMLG